ncbi:hypothetical protein ACWDA3_57105 [Nonomuraea rubra]
MKRFLGSITRRERRFAAAGVVVTLTLLVPVVATAEPGLIPGTEPGVEQAVDVERGDSCRGMLPADTPSYVVCRWLTPPQDAAEVATFWAAGDGANLERAQPLPTHYVRCNRKTDFSTSRTCKDGETFCKQLPSGWYQCINRATGHITYERYTGGNKTVTTSSPSPAATPTTTQQAQGTTLVPDGNPSDAPTTPTTTRPAASSTALPTVGTEPTPSRPPSATGATTPATQAIAAARTTQPRLRIWVESDLADDYTAGEARFTTALEALVTAAKRPGVAGVKFADNLGYTSFTNAEDVTQFLTSASSALRAALPGKRLSIGVVVPELGCGSAKSCIQTMRAKAPLATKENITRYLKTRAADRVDISTGLFGRTYRQHQVPDPKTGKPTPITPALAAQAQWMSIRALEWDTLAQLGAREYGLAHTGDTSPWDKATATTQVDARIGTAIALGVPTITLWGHKTVDDNRTYRLLDAGLTPNAMWTVLTSQGLHGRLAAIIDPASTERSLTADLAELAKGVSDVFILL